jgi:predicted Zn-dependent protease
MWRTYRKYHAVLVAIGLIVQGCAATDLPSFKNTKRLQLQDDETRVWNRSREEQQRLDRSHYLYQDPALTAYVNQVAQNLVPSDLADKDLKIEIKILRNPQLNAFAYPNGVIYMHTGILAKMENEAQLATLIGHEMTHVTHRHTIENFRSVKNTTALLSTVQLATMPFGVYGDLANILGSVGAMAAISGYSKEAEREADREGLKLMIDAGYDPREAPRLFEHLQTDIRQQEISEPYFFGSHPRLQERIDNYNQFLKDSPAVIDGVRNTERFSQHITPLILDNAVLDLSMGRFQSAQKGIEDFLEKRPLSAHAHFWYGELYRQRKKETDLERAILHYQTAIICDGKLPGAYRALGLIYYKQQQYAQARKNIETYMELAPDAEDRDYMEQYLKSIDARSGES